MMTALRNNPAVSISKAQRFTVRERYAVAAEQCACGRGPIAVDVLDGEDTRWYAMCRECAAAGMQE